MNIILKQESTGRTKTVKEGYSWTSLFFGVFVPLFRGDLIGFVIQFALALLTGGLSWLIVPFFYNDRYKNRLIDKGYRQI